jgi:hypothetical protein
MGSYSGVLFSAEVDDRDGTTYVVNFILTMPDVTRGVRRIRKLVEEGEYALEIGIGVVPIPDLYEFTDLSNRSHMVH